MLTEFRDNRIGQLQCGPTLSWLSRSNTKHGEITFPCFTIALNLPIHYLIEAACEKAPSHQAASFQAPPLLLTTKCEDTWNRLMPCPYALTWFSLWAPWTSCVSSLVNPLLSAFIARRQKQYVVFVCLLIQSLPTILTKIMTLTSYVQEIKIVATTKNPKRCL